MVGGLGGCCGTIRPRRVGPFCGNDISPADLNEITPVLSREFDMKRTRPPCNQEIRKKCKHKNKYEITKSFK